MLRVLIKPSTFRVTPMQDGQNPYIDINYHPDHKKIMHQHSELEKALSNTVTYTINSPQHPLPDIVFIANGGLCLPRLPKPMIVLPRMKYRQRQEELSYLKKIYADMRIETVHVTGKEPFEGQAELKWFCKGTKAVCGYGHRSTKKTFSDLNRLFERIYGAHGLSAPELLVIPLASADYYHLDVAMLEYDDTKCIVHKRAFDKTAMNKLKQFLGSENVHVIDTEDSFCLNAVVDGNRLITHQVSHTIQLELERITNKKVHKVNTSEFENSGGSVRCMTLDIFP